MVRPLMTDTVFLAQKALPADADDISGHTFLDFHKYPPSFEKLRQQTLPELLRLWRL